MSSLDAPYSKNPQKPQFREFTKNGLFWPFLALFPVVVSHRYYETPEVLLMLLMGPQYKTGRNKEKSQKETKQLKVSLLRSVSSAVCTNIASIGR